MTLLLKAALQYRKHYFIMVVAIITTFGMTIAAQMEMFSFGLITNTGQDFFTLFAPEKEGKIITSDQITLREVEQKWPEIDKKGTGAISKSEATDYMAMRPGANQIQKIFGWVKSKIDISKDLTLLAFLLLGVALFKAITLFGSQYTRQLVAIRVSRDLRLKYFEHIQGLSMSFYQRHNVGGLAARVSSDASTVAKALNGALINYLETPFKAISTLTLCFILSWKLSLIIFIGLPALLFPILFFARRVKRIAKQLQKNQEGFSSVLYDFLSGIQTVKVFASENFSYKKYHEENRKMAKLEEKSARYAYASRPVLHTVGILFLSSVILYGIHVAQMSVSEIFVYCGLLYLFYEPIKKFNDENLEIQKGIAAAERMYEVLNEHPEIADRHDAIPIQAFKHSIEFDNVWFRYQNEWILKGVSFIIKKGEMVAFVGPTGAGKTTIAQLLPRLYDVQQGEIRIDGKPLQAYTQNSLRELMGFVPQKPFLFLDTIAENISFGRSFSEKQVEEAAKRAYADEFIQRLANKYQTVIAETGKDLSGGQQQRLAIARALVKNAPILVMDEATSSLDAISESRIKKALSELQGEKTQIVIAHRLTTIEHADRIIYFDKGEKVAEGTKEELLAACPPFRIMWEMMHLKKEDKAVE